MTGVVPRAAGFLGLWLVLTGADPADLVVGLVTAAAATWTSLRLLPPPSWRPRPLALAGIAVRSLWQAVLGGTDVARRALHPGLPLRPGFVNYPVRLPAGTAQDVFRTLASLVPGSVPMEVIEGRGMLVHCLDVGQPVAAQMATEEALLTRALGISPGPAASDPRPRSRRA